MKKQAFSLTEVAIAIAIILIVATISFVILGTFRRQSNDSVCFSHFRSIHQAMMLYRADQTASMEFTGGMSQLGFPYWIRDSGAGKMIIANREDWNCPSPKPMQLARVWPQYKYVILNVQAGRGESALADYVAKYGGLLPLVSDLNHNNFAQVNMAAPVVRKQILFISLDGSAKSVVRTGSFADPGDLSPYGFTFP